LINKDAKLLSATGHIDICHVIEVVKFVEDESLVELVTLNYVNNLANLSNEGKGALFQFVKVSKLFFDVVIGNKDKKSVQH
jgi:hypothetical protein